MQIPGLNLLNVPSPVVTPSESPAEANEQRRSSDSASPVSAPDAPELHETTPTAPSDQSPEQDSFNHTVTYDNRERSQTDTVPATAMPTSLDPLDLALADQSSDSSGDEDAEVESTNTDRYCYSYTSH